LQPLYNQAVCKGIEIKLKSYHQIYT